MNPEKYSHESYENNNELEVSNDNNSEIINSSEKKVNELSNVNSQKDDGSIISSIPVVLDDSTSDIVKGDSSRTVHPSVTLLAKDKDLIEKVWVTRAKKIIEQTKENPHQQEEAINTKKSAMEKI